MPGLIPPGLVAGVLLWLILSGLLYAFWPYGRRSYLPVLLGTGAGLGLGQAWLAVGLPGLRLGEVDLLPGILFAAALQPLAERLPIRFP